MKWLLTGILLCFYILCWSQQSLPSIISSLETKLSTAKNDRAKLNVLSKLIGYYQQSDSKKAFSYEEEALAAATRLKSDSDICNFSGYAGESYVYQSNYKMAIPLFNKEYDIAKKNNYKKYMSTAVLDIGMAYELQGEYTQSLDYFFKGLKLADQANNIVLKTVCALNISAVYLNEKNFDKTIFYANQVFKALKIIHNHDFNTKADEFIGSAYIGKKDYKEAQKHYLTALRIYTADKNQYGIAVINSLLSGTYTNDYQKQLELGLKAQTIFDKIAPIDLYAINNLGGIGVAYGNIAKEKAKNSAEAKALYAKAEENLGKAIVLANQTNSKQNIMELSDSLSVIEAATGKFKEAYSNLTVRNKLYDSIYSQDNKNKIASLEGKHEIDLRDKQLLINKLEIANQHKQRWFLLGGLLTLFIISGLIYYQNMQRKKTNTTLLHLNSELDEANKVKTRFFSILNHDLRSPVASFVNFLHLQQEAPDLIDEAAQSAYSKKATLAAENLLNTMEDLLLWSKGQMENFKPSIREVPVSILYSYLEQAVSPNESISISFEQQPNMMLNIDEHYIKTIMLNLTNNAVKALAGNGTIIWRAWEEGEQKYLSITDNGPGASEEAFKALYDESAPVGIKTGLGLHIIRDLAKAIGCKILVLAKPGSGVELMLKLS